MIRVHPARLFHVVLFAVLAAGCVLAVAFWRSLDSDGADGELTRPTTELRDDWKDGNSFVSAPAEPFLVVPTGGNDGFRVTVAPGLGNPAQMMDGIEELVPFLAGFEIPPNTHVAVDATDLRWKRIVPSKASTLREVDGGSRKAVETIPLVEHALIGSRHFARVSFNPVQTFSDGEVWVASGSFSYATVGEALAIPEPIDDGGDSLLDPDAEGDCVCSRIEREEVLPEPQGLSGNFARRRAGDEVNAGFRIAIHQTGLHKLTQQTLLAAGVNPSDLIGDRIRMFYRDQEMSIFVNRADLFTDPGDFILFFAEGISTYHTGENAVWLGFGSGGLRWETRDSTPLPSGASVQSSACMEVLFDENRYHYPEYIGVLREKQLPVGDYDGWGIGIATKDDFYGDLVTDLRSGPTDFTVTDRAQRAQVRVFSRTETSHDLHLRKNFFSNIADWSWSGVDRLSLEATFTNQLDSADTILALSEEADEAFSLILIEEMELQVERELYIHDGSLGFAGSDGPVNIEVAGIGDVSSLILLDVTEIARPVRCVGGEAFDAAATLDGWRFSHGQAASRCYYAAEASGILEVGEGDLSSRPERWLGDPARTADYLVIAPDVFKEELQRLLEHRDYSGLEVCVAPAQDVYNEFGYGIEGPEAIKQLIGYAFHHWREAPRMVLLVGDGRYNPLDHDDDVDHPNWIPAPMGAATDSWTAFDLWYTTVNGSDLVPDLSLGRMPVEGPEQLAEMVDRILAFEPALALSDRSDASSWRRNVTLVAGHEGDQGFDAYCEELRTDVLTETNLTVSTAYSTGGNANAVTTAIRDAFSNGSIAVSYTGHGANDSWDAQSIMDPTIAAGLTTSGGRKPIVTVFSCLNGAFHHHEKPGQDTATESLGELFLRHGDGAVAVLAPSSLALASVSQYGAIGFYEALFLNRYLVGIQGSVHIHELRDTHYLGDAQLNMMASIFLAGGADQTLLSYVLLGDPALVVDPEPLEGAAP